MPVARPQAGSRNYLLGGRVHPVLKSLFPDANGTLEEGWSFTYKKTSRRKLTSSLTFTFAYICRFANIQNIMTSFFHFGLRIAHSARLDRRFGMAVDGIDIPGRRLPSHVKINRM
jgi:hypothetical protein